MANVVVKLVASDMFSLIAIHLYVFYYGLADVTPQSVSIIYGSSNFKSGPIRTGIQAFWYSLRTGILPIVFIFNNELLLIGIELAHGLIVMITSLIAILVFTALRKDGLLINLSGMKL